MRVIETKMLVLLRFTPPDLVYLESRLRDGAEDLAYFNWKFVILYSVRYSVSRQKIQGCPGSASDPVVSMTQAS